MRKMLLTMMLFSTLAAGAQKRLVGFEAPVTYKGEQVNFAGRVSWLEDGRPDQFRAGMSLDGQFFPVTVTQFTYADDKILHTTYEWEQSENYEYAEPTVALTASLENGKANNVSYVSGYDEYAFDMTYNEEGQLVGVHGYDEWELETDGKLTWENGNLTSMSVRKGPEYEKYQTMEITYEDAPSTLPVNALLSYFVEGQLTKNRIFGLTPFKPFGLEFANLPSTLSRPDVPTVEFTYTYDEDGDVNSIVMDGLLFQLDQWTYVGHLEVELLYEDVPVTGVSTPKMVKSTEEQVYNMGGQRVNARQRGLNIVRGTDGRVSKVLVR